MQVCIPTATCWRTFGSVPGHMVIKTHQQRRAGRPTQKGRARPLFPGIVRPPAPLVIPWEMAAAAERSPVRWIGGAKERKEMLGAKGRREAGHRTPTGGTIFCVNGCVGRCGCVLTRPSGDWDKAGQGN